MIKQQNKFKRPKPVGLIVLDGWGIAQPYSGNAISQAKIPVLNDLISHYPTMTLRASGEAVGLPWSENGNSEVGHLNLGLGRIIYQNLPRINKTIADNSFFSNQALIGAFKHARENKSKVHLLGLVSNGCVHSSIEHLEALLAMAKNEKIDDIFIHAILDGRDTAYNSGQNFIKDLERAIREHGRGKIATISGRFYAMDRDNRWDRISKSYAAITEGRGNKSETANRAIEESYLKKIYDEEFAPAVIYESGNPVALVEDNDSIIFFNYREDRARQITKAFVLPTFDKFKRPKYLRNLHFVTFTEYEKDLPVEVAFPPESLKNTLGEVISRAGLKQLRIAETEKYAHVTYFFNGGEETKFKGEDNELIPSPHITSYDLKPEMSAPEVAEKLVKHIDNDEYDFFLVNFANADMVGHTGNIKASVKAIETVDKCLGKVVKSVLAKDGAVFITADHGNAEDMFNMQTGSIDKEHSTNPVPFIIVSRQFEGLNLGGQEAPNGDLSLIKPQGILSDVAPTILKIMGIEKPEDMTGRALI
jgi:2,3-bisphosphoglycerate-independent phosphoglycerate mutase